MGERERERERERRERVLMEQLLTAISFSFIANTFIAGASFTNKVEYRLTGANGPSCEESLICLVDPLSSACAAVQSGIRSLVTTENLSPSSVRVTGIFEALSNKNKRRESNFSSVVRTE